MRYLREQAIGLFSTELVGEVGRKIDLKTQKHEPIYHTPAILSQEEPPQCLSSNCAATVIT